jgi:hypothetical protein
MLRTEFIALYIFMTAGGSVVATNGLAAGERFSDNQSVQTKIDAANMGLMVQAKAFQHVFAKNAQGVNEPAKDEASIFSRLQAHFGKAIFRFNLGADSDSDFLFNLTHVKIEAYLPMLDTIEYRIGEGTYAPIVKLGQPGVILGIKGERRGDTIFAKVMAYESGKAVEDKNTLMLKGALQSELTNPNPFLLNSVEWTVEGLEQTSDEIKIKHDCELYKETFDREAFLTKNNEDLYKFSPIICKIELRYARPTRTWTFRAENVGENF